MEGMEPINGLRVAASTVGTQSETEGVTDWARQHWEPRALGQSVTESERDRGLLVCRRGLTLGGSNEKRFVWLLTPRLARRRTCITQLRSG